ncbi:hypothetical protein G4G27_14860 [Sphingomonas sp. So64.6b]|uniref:hypothetical protein n=1 Tax=Sphingomonas sp. So64.6b TaxID=2997354 RepID=UPI00160115F0|nr:hypothetical protein [Sphingomonas sp. So64.6b]QNA85132.1 hypothetical protein G4G27_14860 [Sphingomonas sp. So64.6b]
MIPLPIGAWIRTHLIPAPIPTLIMTALAVVLALFGWQQWQRARAAQTETRLATGQAGAALHSGADAVETLGNRMAADAAGDHLTRENDDAIRSADGAAAPVAAGVRDAGLAGLCRRAAYRGDPQCVQQPDPR